MEFLLGEVERGAAWAKSWRTFNILPSKKHLKNRTILKKYIYNNNDKNDKKKTLHCMYF